MQSKQLLAEFITNILTKDEATAKQAFSRACSMKTKELLINEASVEEPKNAFAEELLMNEGFMNHLYNLGGKAMNALGMGGNAKQAQARPTQQRATPNPKEDAEELIDLQGDKILIRGKVVGRTFVDDDDIDGGVNFVSSDGKFSKEFNTVEELFRYVVINFLGAEHAA